MGWKERSQFTLTITSQGEQRWHVKASCTPRATILARHVIVEDAPTTSWSAMDSPDMAIKSTDFIVKAAPAHALRSHRKRCRSVADFLHEQGYPTVGCLPGEAALYALYLDKPEGLGKTRQEQLQQRSTLVEKIERLEQPLIRLGTGPMGTGQPWQSVGY